MLKTLAGKQYWCFDRVIKKSTETEVLRQKVGISLMRNFPKDYIISIFQITYSPLHDGAVIFHNGKNQGSSLHSSWS